MLEACHLTLRQHGQVLLDNISLTAQVGEMTVIAGPNGAGKSTLLSLLAGRQAPSSGQIRLCGHDLQQLSAKVLSRLRAMLEQSPGWQPGFSAAELVMIGSYLSPVRQTDWKEAMRLMYCDELALRQVETLSGGERQRVQLARTLLQLLSSTEPQRFLLLDEPTAALDFGLADALMAQLCTLAHTLHIGVVAVVHDLNLAGRHADRILLMKNGQSTAFGPSQEIMQKDRLETIYGIRLAELISQDEQLRAFVPLTADSRRD